MSGVKISEFRIAKEREQRLREVGRLQQQMAECLSVRAAARETLDSASAGLRASYREVVTSATEWLQSIADEGQDVGDATPMDELRRRAVEWERRAKVGRELLCTLRVTFTEIAGARNEKLGREVADVESELISRQSLIERWGGARLVASWTRDLQRVRDLLKKQQFGDVGTLVSRLREEIRGQVRQCELKETQHQNRMYLLKALRGVCADMGFQEVGGPTWERPEARESRIRIDFDTADRGRVVFWLGLQGIHGESQIDGNHCFEEFTQLERFLNEKFGVATHFRMPDGTEIPRPDERAMREEPAAESRGSER